MTEYHGKRKRKNYFEGWYFKCRNSTDTIAFIPGVRMGKNGQKSAFVQAIGRDGSHWFPYPYEEFSADSKALHVRVGENEFSEQGMKLCLREKGISITGEVGFGGFLPISYDIMGPFSLLPLMECHHGVVSMRHVLQGGVVWNNEICSLDGGCGYIEKDWGSSFPSSYLWTQCSDQADVMVSIANIPFCGMNFTGCICSIFYKGKEYRLATYLGGKAVRWCRDGFELKQGNYTLTGSFDPGHGFHLAAPRQGEMARTIHENAACYGRYRFLDGECLIFDMASDRASFEFADEN